MKARSQYNPLACNLLNFDRPCIPVAYVVFHAINAAKSLEARQLGGPRGWQGSMAA